jgi:DNA-binding SARP family transcriptional activator
MAGISGRIRGGPRTADDQDVEHDLASGGEVRRQIGLARWQNGSVGRGRAGFSAVLRVALVLSAPVVLVVGLSNTVLALPVGRQFAPTSGAVAWSAALGDGTTQSAPVTIDAAEVALGDELPDGDQLVADQHYFYVALHPNYEFAGVLTPIAMPPTGATLSTAGGTVTGQEAPSNLGDDAQWFFPVPADLGSATLQVDGFSKVLGNERGDFIPWTFGPSTIDFVATSPLPSSPTTSVPARPAHPHPKAGASKPVTASKAGGLSVGAKVGGGVAGLAVLIAGGAGLGSLVRRRRFYRADKEKRITVSSSALVAGAILPGGAVLRPAGQAILVKILGALQLEGAKRKTISVPVLEIIVFLVLNPGQTFNSAQLRERIWGLGRKAITSGTFRNYMTELRKVLGPGMVVTERYNFTMTGAVTCDRDQFRAVLEGGDVLAGREEALALVRGPVLHGAFEGRNSPFTWALDEVHLIEDEVTSVAVDLALACLAQGDPARASRAVASGLLCMEADLRLRTVDLEVGAAIGGPSEVGRRLQAAKASMATFPHDVAELERAARRLGWEAPVSG